MFSFFSLFPPTLKLTIWLMSGLASYSNEVCWEMPLCHFFAPCPTLSSSASLWYQCKVPPTHHSLVTAYLQRSQAQASGTAPRSGLGDWGVSQETQHKYRDPNKLITSGAIRLRILESYLREDVCFLRQGSLGTGWTKGVWVITSMGCVNLR